jgi:hypothetical protein
MKTSTAAIGVGGAIIGFVTGFLWPREPETKTRITDVATGRPAEPAPRPIPSGTTVEQRRFEDPAGDAAGPASRVASAPFGETGELFSRELLAHFDAQYRRAWALRRSDAPTDEEVGFALARFKESVLGFGGAQGRRDAESKTKSEAAAKPLEEADPYSLMLAIAAGAWKATPDALEEGLLGRVTARRTQGAGVEGEGLKTAPSAGTTINYGPGVHRVSSRLLVDRTRSRGLPDDLAFVGAGMDSTLLIVDGSFSTNEELHGLTFRDLTLTPKEGQCGPFDLRGPSATVDLERVRIVGYDCGAGGSVCFDARPSGAFIRASQCEFLGGFGRSPWSGHCNLAYGSPLIGRFDGCRFEGTELNTRYASGGGALLFKSCVFALAPSDPLAGTHAGVRFVDCVTESTQSSTQAPPGPKRELSEWFPQLRK